MKNKKKKFSSTSITVTFRSESTTFFFSLSCPHIDCEIMLLYQSLSTYTMNVHDNAVADTRTRILFLSICWKNKKKKKIREKNIYKQKIEIETSSRACTEHTDFQYDITIQRNVFKIHVYIRYK